MKNNWLKSLRRLGMAALLALLALPGLAQTITGADVPEMADAMRQNGKIYVVVAVIVPGRRTHQPETTGIAEAEPQPQPIGA